MKRIGATSLQDIKGVALPEIMLQSMKLAKGGVIGTNDKPVVALRFDDYQDTFRTDIYSLLTARGLPASMALVSRFTTKEWGDGTTWDNIRTWNRGGVEMWSHGTDHLDYIPDGAAGLYRELVTSKQEIEAQSIKCMGFVMPGVTPLTEATPYYGLDDLSLWGDEAAPRLLYATYALSETYAVGKYRTLPGGVNHGLNHLTVSDGVSLATAQGYIDTAILYGYGVELMCHSGNLGVGGNMSLADFTTLLDYIVTKWEAGTIEVLTPSGLIFADPSTTRRLDLIRNPGFEGITVSGSTAGQWANFGAGRTIEVTGGRTGANFLSITSVTANLVTQRPSDLQTLGLGGEQFLFEGWFRSNGGGNTVGRVILKDYDDTSRLNLNLTKTSDGATWTRFRYAFGLHPSTNRLELQLGRSSGDGVDWDDISIKKV